MTPVTGTPSAYVSSAIDPFSDGFLTDPFPALAEIRNAAPVVYLERCGVFAVARHEQVSSVLRSPQVFSSAAGVGISNFATEKPSRKPSILLEVDPPVHTHNRRVVACALAPRSLAYLQEIFDRRADELAGDLVARGSFDAVPDLAEIFPTRVFPEALGIGAEGVIGWITEQSSRSSLRPDGLGALIYAGVDAGEVTEEEAALLVRSFLSAGLDTTVSAIGLGVLDFARHPGQWQALREDPSLARNAFEEVVRRESPVVGFFRTTSEPVDLAGTLLPGDAKVLVFFAGANRDPRHWEDPDRFDIRRKTAGHMGFGIGVHNCVGQVIARMEGEAVFRALASRVASWRLTGEPRPRLNNTLRSLDTLPVAVEPG